MNAIVLAGGPSDAVAALTAGAANKAFVPIAGTTLVERTLRALRDVPRVGHITVVAPAVTHELPALALADERRVDGARMIDSLRSGSAGCAPDEIVIVAASDLPVLTRAAIDEFIDLVRQRDLDIGYACLARRYHDACCAYIPHTWARMRDGQFCGGGLTALKPRALPRLANVLDALGAARKAPLRLAGVLGWDILARFALGQLSIAAAETRASALLQAPVGAICCTHPEIAVNVDRPADIALAERFIAAMAR